MNALPTNLFLVCEDISQFSQRRQDMHFDYTSQYVPPHYLKKQSAIQNLNNSAVVTLHTERFLISKKVERLKELVSPQKLECFFYRHGKSNFAAVVLPASQALPFFKLLQQLQKEKPKMVVRRQSFFDEVDQLTLDHFLTAAQAEEIKSAIKSVISFEEYRESAFSQKEPIKLLSLARYYQKKEDFDLAIECLSLLCKSDSLHFLLNLRDFFEDIQQISTIDFFRPHCSEMQKVLIQSKTLKMLKLCTNIYDPGNHTAAAVADFLKKTQSVTTLTLGKDSSGHPTKKDFINILAEGLKKNSSVEKLDLSGSQFDEDHIIPILEALRENESHKITSLEMSCLDITDKTAQYLLELLQKQPQINALKLDRETVNKSFRIAIDTLMQQRSKPSD